MYILLWSNENEEGWDIEDSAEELQERVYELMEDNCSPEDMMIFNYRDDYITPEQDGKVIIG